MAPKLILYKYLFSTTRERAKLMISIIYFLFTNMHTFIGILFMIMLKTRPWVEFFDQLMHWISFYKKKVFWTSCSSLR